MELKIKHLAPYLPYGLKIKILNHKCDYVGIEYAVANGFYFLGENLHVTYEGGSTGKDVNIFKPILRPLSDVIKTIMYTKTNYVVASMMWAIDAIEEKNFEVYGIVPDYWKSCLQQLKEDVRNVDYGDFEILIRHHFDVFGLIEVGLAIDINTLSK